MTMRALRLLLLAVMLLAPVGRIGIAQAMAAPAEAKTAMDGHCADMPASAPSHHRQAPTQGDEGKAVDCMIACAAMTTATEPFVAPAPLAEAQPGTLVLFSPAGIRPEADPPPPRRS
jgi:hypothetical protein